MIGYQRNIHLPRVDAIVLLNPSCDHPSIFSKKQRDHWDVMTALCKNFDLAFDSVLKGPGYQRSKPMMVEYIKNNHPLRYASDRLLHHQEFIKGILNNGPPSIYSIVWKHVFPDDIKNQVWFMVALTRVLGPRAIQHELNTLGFYSDTNVQNRVLQIWPGFFECLVNKAPDAIHFSGAIFAMNSPSIDVEMAFKIICHLSQYRILHDPTTLLDFMTSIRKLEIVLRVDLIDWNMMYDWIEDPIFIQDLHMMANKPLDNAPSNMLVNIMDFHFNDLKMVQLFVENYVDKAVPFFSTKLSRQLKNAISTSNVAANTAFFDRILKMLLIFLKAIDKKSMFALRKFNHKDFLKWVHNDKSLTREAHNIRNLRTYADCADAAKRSELEKGFCSELLVFVHRVLLEIDPAKFTTAQVSDLLFSCTLEHGWIVGYIPSRLLSAVNRHLVNKYYLYRLAVKQNPWVRFCFDKNGMKLSGVDSLYQIHKVTAIDFSGDSFLYKMAHKQIMLKYRLPKLCAFMLKRHCELKSANVAAQVDKWLIDHKLDDWSKS